MRKSGGRLTFVGVLLVWTGVFIGCDREPKEVGGTCASMGGRPCVCPDDRRSCTDINNNGLCICATALLTAPQLEGGDCSSLGGERCDCPDGTTACSDHAGTCLCPGATEPGLAPVGADCSSLGGEPCVCGDGSASCTDRSSRCLCDGTGDPTVPVPQSPPSDEPG